MKVKTLVTMELEVGEAATEEDVKTLVAETWEAGDPNNATKAVIAVTWLDLDVKDDADRVPDSPGPYPDRHLADGQDEHA